MKYMSYDAETNGLWGQAFAISAVLVENGKVAKTFLGRCPISGEINPWVKENVLPQMEDIKVTHESYESLLKDFMSFWRENRENTTAVTHMGCPVEARLWIDAHNLGIIGDWDAPYIGVVDLASYSEIGVSVDSYNKDHELVPCPESMVGGTHNPLYDSYAAAVAFTHYKSGQQLEF